MLPRKFPAVISYLYLQILYISVSCEDGISLAFVIDDTLSMTKVINDVKAHAKSILDVALDEKSSEVKDLVLVSINDPVSEFKVKTNSSSVFIKHLNDIYVHNSPTNKYCPEMAMAGIQEALLKSRVGSYMFVFTDSLACDADKVDIIKDLAQKKQTQVIIILIVGYCYTPSNSNTVYHDVAKASSGQVMTVDINEMDGVLKVIRELLHGKKTVLKWEELPRTYGGLHHEVKFFVDEKTDYVTIHSNSRDISLEVETLAYPGFHETVKGQKRVMWSSNSKVVMLSYPKSGTYFAKVAGSTTITLVVYARTDFTFEHGFSTYETNSLNNTSKQPSNKGIRQHLYIQIIDPDNSVQVKNVQLLNLNGEVLEKKTLRNVGIHFYVTSPFRAPTQLFNIVVVGKMTSSGKEIKRVSKTPVEPPPPIPESIPTVKLNEGNFLEVKYGKEITLLTCKVNAHPEPAIVWTDGEGHTLPSQSLEGEAPEYISNLKLNNLKKSDTYTCQASNTKGTSYKRIKVDVKSAFEIVSTPKATTNVKYGEEVKIVCNIESKLPMDIRWYKSETELIASKIYSISADRTTLTIKAMDLDSQGNYTCQAYLTSEPSNKVLYRTDVRIAGLERPVIEPSNKAVHLMKRGKFELRCKITMGYPQPQMHWFKRDGDVYKQMLHEHGEVLLVTSALLSHSGQYKCVAQNGLAEVSALFDVIVRGLPESVVIETQRTFPYGSAVEFTCKVESYYVLPTITWIDKRGTVLENKVTQTSTYDFISRLKLESVKKSGVYTCLARNDVGNSSVEVVMKVSSPFVVRQHPETLTEIPYGTEKIIPCDIKSSHPMTIQWYRQNRDVKSIRNVLHPSDKLSISPDGTKLIIKSMDLDLKGIYICEASLKADQEQKISFNTHINVTGLVYPEVFGDSFMSGNKAFTAICRAKGVPKPVITWLFKPKGSEKFHEMSIAGEELNIPKLSLKDTGTFKCVVNNILGEVSHNFDLVVKEEPKITNMKDKYKSLKGDRVLKIPCEVTGFPVPAIIWRKAGEVVQKNSKYDIIGNVLYIKNLEETDTAKYICTAVNELGTAQKSFEITVTDGFKTNDYDLKGKIHSIFTIKNKPVTILCNATNSDTLQVRWYLNGNDTQRRGKSYSIASATEGDNGIYTCRVDTNEGSTSESYEFHVGYPPTFVYDSPSVIEWSGDNVDLDCNVKSEPEPQIQWFHNGKEIPMSNLTQELEGKDWGEYKCILSNVHGSVQRTFKIVSTDCYVNQYMTTQNMPLWFDDDMKTWPMSSSSGGISLKAHKTITLVCAAKEKSPNAFQVFPNKNKITAECYKEDQFIVDGKNYKFSELQCKTKVEPLIVNTHEECSGPHTEMIQVGFVVDHFMEAYKVCYDKSKKVPVFGSTPIIISDFTRNEQSLFEWSQIPTVGDIKPSGGYTCQHNLTDCCYRKSQLVSVEEVVFGPVQAATLIDNLNSVAVWVPCNRDTILTWETFEKQVRALSSESSWVSWSGASDYRIKNHGLVPQYLWKVINNQEDYTVVVYINNPEYEESDQRCSSSCDLLNLAEMGFDSLNFYCCNLDEFSKAFGVQSFKSTRI